MIISHRRKFIFIHVSKSAGTSVQSALRQFADRPEDRLINRSLARIGVHVNYWFAAETRLFREHATASTVRNHLPAGLFDHYFTFAFVRNPWDWLVSLYHYLLKTPSHRHHERVAAMRTFGEYVDFEIARGKRSQSEFVCDPTGRVLVNFVGRFESLDSDFATACHHIGVDVPLPHVNRSTHADYRTYYRDPALIDLVAKHFCRDIETFSYCFDGCTSNQPLVMLRMKHSLSDSCELAAAGLHDTFALPQT